MSGKKTKNPNKLGKLPNVRGGFYHVHSGMFECGMAYRLPDGEWSPCSKLVNHGGDCGYEDNSAY